MTRRNDDRPTTIYWLLDVRPETLVDGWPKGRPFYCGKTIGSTDRRLKKHIYDSQHYWPDRKITKALLKCGRDIQIITKEVVPAKEDWCAREKWWIAEVRKLNSECANISDGGDGVPGYVPSAKTRAKLGAIHRGKKLSFEQIELLRKIHLGSKHSLEIRRKRAESNRGQKRSAEFCEKNAMRHRGKKRSSEARAKMSAAKLGRKQSPEHVANMRAAVVGKPKSEAHRAALREAWTRRRLNACKAFPFLSVDSQRL